MPRGDKVRETDTLIWQLADLESGYGKNDTRRKKAARIAWTMAHKHNDAGRKGRNRPQRRGGSPL